MCITSRGITAKKTMKQNLDLATGREGIGHAKATYKYYYIKPEKTLDHEGGRAGMVWRSWITVQVRDEAK